MCESFCEWESPKNDYEFLSKIFVIKINFIKACDVSNNIALQKYYQLSNRLYHINKIILDDSDRSIYWV